MAVLDARRPRTSCTRLPPSPRCSCRLAWPASRGFGCGVAFGLLLSFLGTALPQSSLCHSASEDAPLPASAWLIDVLQGWSTSCDAPGLVAAQCHLVAALIDGSSITYARVVAGDPGSAALLPPSSPAVHQLYEIASITKVFTALVLARLSAVPGSGVFLTATVGDLYPALLGQRAQMRDPRLLEVTLEHLASHTAGMPRMPPRLHGTPNNPFSGYTDDDLLQACLQLELAPHLGTFFYSNFGFGLLGRLLEV